MAEAFKNSTFMKNFFFLILAISLFCKPNSEKKIEKILSNSTITDESALVLIAREVWGEEFKSAETERLKNSKILIKVVSGYKTALTFYSQEDYAKNTITQISIRILQMLQSGKSRNLDSLVVVFSKPFYIKGTEEMQDEFEIFRARVDMSDIKNPDEIFSINYFDEFVKGKPSKKAIQNAEQIRKIWKVELNDFGRIEVK